MKVNVYLTVAGQEAVAKGEVPRYWDLTVRPCEGYPWDIESPKDSCSVASEVTLTLPDRTVCALAAIEHLHAEQRRIYAESAAEVAELKKREESLLALTYTPPQGASL